MNLDKFKEDIYKCSGCGQCQSVCPIYKVLKSECAVSRGKFNLLNAIVNRDIKLSKKTEKIMDLCLNCGACKEFCPAAIDATKIINAAKVDLFEQNVCSFSKKNFPVISVFPKLLKIFKCFLDFYRNSGLINKIENINQKFFHNLDLTLINSFLKIKVKPVLNSQINNPVMKVAYFKGCMNNYINPSSFNAAKKILNGLNVEIIEPDFLCCGQALKNTGNIKLYKKIACKNLDLVPNDIDYIVTDCASCLTSLKEYSAFLNGSYKKKAEELNDKIISIYELLEKLEYCYDKELPCTVVYHNPCANRFNSQEDTIYNLLKKSKNTKIIATDEKNECCGASLPFALKNRELALKISENNTEKFINSDADIVLTSCPLCYIGLKQGLLTKKSNMEVMQVIEYLYQT